MSNVVPTLAAGIPCTSDYKYVLGSQSFGAMETFSNDFLRRNAFLLDHYKWVKDPLHQWSRQWEYPYVYQEMTEYVAGRLNPHTPIKVLDAGSGITFFPYFMRSMLKNLDITCCDSDDALAPLFDLANLSANDGLGVKFIKAGLHTLPFASGSIDVIYSISVLEHTHNYAQILDEFHRILCPGGRLALTFDIGLDGVSEVSPESARRLLGEITRRFTCLQNSPDIDTGAVDILASRHVSQCDSRLAPWRYPRLALIKAALSAKRMPTSLVKNLTVYCNTFVKSEN